MSGATSLQASKDADKEGEGEGEDINRDTGNAAYTISSLGITPATIQSTVQNMVSLLNQELRVYNSDSSRSEKSRGFKSG